jgi:N-acetylneuraminic acid mutarotase
MPLTYPNQYEPTIFSQTPFWLRPVLLQSKLVLVSSDLARVKVTRHDPATGQKREWVVDCSKGGDSAPNLWLQDGDRIEVPEKTYPLGAQAEALPAAAPGMAPPPAPAQPGPRNFVPPPSRVLRAPAAGPPQAAVPLQYQWRTDQPREAPAAQTPQGAEQQPPFTQRLQNIISRGSGTPQAAEDEHLSIGGVVYSPKPDDPELLKAGYHKDRAARTRNAENWEQRAGAELSGRACPAVWTGTDMIVFGGEGIGTSFDDGARYCFAEDTWAALPQKGAPSSRTGHAIVWTGKEVIVWGGFGGVWGNGTNHNDGARYNPASDTWKPVSTKNAPAARFDFPAVWSGKEMLVWGGYTDHHSRYQGAHADAYLNTGGRYDPATDTWKAITTEGAPSRRSFHSLHWTGKEMIVWGGGNANKVLSDGGRYNPARDAWRPISTDGAPSPRYGQVSVWTGKEMIVWGGSAREPSAPSDYFENGARYNPATDTWMPISSVGAPKGCVCVTAVWTGTEMVLWGGVNDARASGEADANRYVGTGARYNPATDTWTEITTTGTPSPRLTSVVWTGDGLLAFGGYNGSHLNDTWFYSPQRKLYPYAKQ